MSSTLQEAQLLLKKPIALHIFQFFSDGCSRFNWLYVNFFGKVVIIIIIIFIV